ncbi:selenide, water dikinase SelD [Butyricicoccus sp.]|uniref:selenide, water dikinase SelD n=1 Tax=Butyricicoccus sp. TaxID=2049021 RepID=UPI003F188084
MEETNKLFCKGGGCTAKLGPAVLERVLSRLPRPTDEQLLVGCESSDDAAVYRLTDDIAVVQTLDFFPPMLEDPYLFGQIAAANALSDIWAMGGTAKTALNIVCFPENMDLNILGAIMTGGNEKVREAGASLAGGHSIADSDVKYGLSVMGTVHPDKIRTNNTCRIGDCLILTKPLGVGLIMTANRVGQAKQEWFDAAVRSMTTLNRWACEASMPYEVHACTDVTGFGLLGHLREMIQPTYSAVVRADSVPMLDGARWCAEEFLLTAAAQRTRNFLNGKVRFAVDDFALEEVLFDPQTSGGLLMSVPERQADALLADIRALGLSCGIIGSIVPRMDCDIIVTK